MLIQYHGHSEFLLETENGIRLLIDQFDNTMPDPYLDLMAASVVCSHHHHDHHAIEKVKGSPRIVDSLENITL